MFKISIKLTMVALMLIAATGCAPKGTRMNSSVTMMALNSVQPFASESFARRMALLIIEDRYPPDVFSPAGTGVVVDGGEVWHVTFDNSLINTSGGQKMPMIDGVVVPKKLTFVIRKRNAEVVDIQ